MTLQQKLDLLPQRFIITKEYVMRNTIYYIYSTKAHLSLQKPLSWNDSLEGAINDAIKKRLKEGAYPDMSPLTKEWLKSQL
jgi:hypothetical protein